MSTEPVGTLTWISGPVVQARREGSIAMADQVWVGEAKLAGEVIRVERDRATIQVYEDTSGLGLGEPVATLGRSLSVELGPGLVGATFDGIQRPLDALREQTGIWVGRGVAPPALDRDREWPFEPRASEGDEVSPGAVLGVVQETGLVEHRVLVPPGARGTIVDCASEGEYRVEDRLAVVEDESGETQELRLLRRWPVRRPRPSAARLQPTIPLITGQRVLDTFFPVARGGAAAVPGPFGSGKTIIQQSLAKWSDAEIIIYVGCGERGNEMTDVLEEFPELEDPRTGQPLMERTIMLANTSNMPVAARESSIYTAVTMAEYYRDQGYDVALMADSTSRWAEALREISGRLGEMPAEEGYPAYLPSRLASFYERAGRVATLGGDEGSVTIIGSVSPPGGDFSEPVTRHTKRFVRSFWALSRDLSSERHYPAVDWFDSYSLYVDRMEDWWEDRTGRDWAGLRDRAYRILQRESDLQEIVQLVGPEALSDEEQWVLEAARYLREGFLQQNAFHPVDAYAAPERQAALLELLVRLHDRGRELMEDGVSLEQIRDTLDRPRILGLKEEVGNDEVDRLQEEWERVDHALGELGPGDADESRGEEEARQ
ncbi:MAG: V-type ATP synthase subunit A [Candidatus Longimicrobiales bacterium M2_2A_002]